MTDLDVKGLRKSFGGQAVLRGLDLAVAEGSFTSILGPSGSGKTTLLRIVAGFEQADHGTVRLGSEVVDDETHHVPPDKRRVGYVPQEGSLFPHISVERNVGFGLSRSARRGTRVGELLEMVGLEGLGPRYPHQLSGGQQQRVALARALAIEPALVLLDEPFSSLDATLRAAVRQDVRRVLADAGTTALLVTHDREEALSLADHVAVMSEGRIGQYDTPQGLYVNPGSPELAQGLGEANIVPGVAHGALVETSLGSLHLDRWRQTDGGALLVLVRPEQIELVPETSDCPARARVIALEYYGHDAVVRVRGAWEPDTVICIRVTDVAGLPAPGTRVGLSVHGSVMGWPAGPGDAASRGDSR